MSRRTIWDLLSTIDTAIFAPRVLEFLGHARVAVYFRHVNKHYHKKFNYWQRCWEHNYRVLTARFLKNYVGVTVDQAVEKALKAIREMIRKELNNPQEAKHSSESNYNYYLYFKRLQ
jgi:hypothetical protein